MLPEAHQRRPKALGTRRVRAKVELLQFPGALRVRRTRRKTLVVLGPNFSGGMDSVGQQVANLVDTEITEVMPGVEHDDGELQSKRRRRRIRQLNYVRLAVDDGTKLLRLADLARIFGYFDLDEDDDDDDQVRRIGKYKVAFLTEASTLRLRGLQSMVANEA